MKDLPSGGLAKAILGAVALVTACSLADRIASTDPMLPVEIAAAGVLGVWAVALVPALWRAMSLSRELARQGEPQVGEEIGYRVIPGRAALVAGPLRPSIYLGVGLIRSLSAAELAAVLHHEEHHRRTRAPLRTVALFAWLAILGRSTLAQRAISGRLLDLERSADAYALRHGVTRAALASALIHADAAPAAAAAAFSSYADWRALALLTATPAERHSHVLPYEWLPLAIVAVVVGLCHITLIGLA